MAPARAAGIRLDRPPGQPPIADGRCRVPGCRRRTPLVNDERRLSAPGRLAAGDGVSSAGILTTELPSEPLAELAARHNLQPSSERPPVLAYLRNLWRRLTFILAFATARNIAMYTEARLGQLWQVLTPLLNAGVYYFIFGIILGTSRGIPDFVSLLQINPAAIYITLVRNALLLSQRLSQPGAKPYNAAKCAQWVHFPKSGLYNSAYCHPVTNPDHYWYFAIGWAVLAVLVGFFYFWRAEAKYGRG